MRRLAAHPKRRTLHSNLRILRTLSPPDYHALESLAEHVLQRRLKDIESSPIWRGPYKAADSA